METNESALISRFFSSTIKVFEYYKSLGMLEYNRMTLPGSLPNDPLLTNLWMFDPDEPYNNNNDPHNQVWRNEEISVNDCFMKNLEKYKYIINKDMDEMIVPLKERSYDEMMKMLEEITQNKVRRIKIYISIVSTFKLLDSWMLVLPEHFLL